AHAAGRLERVYADETRPFLQGARLTAWELARDGIPVTVIADGMAGHLLQRGEVDVIVVGADRIAANGDVANKIGTYPLAVLAREHGVPFYVAAPLSTVDLATPDGAAIPIEERGRDEAGPDRGRRGGPARRAGPPSGLRRDAASARDRHHHGARHRARALRGGAARAGRAGARRGARMRLGRAVRRASAHGRRRRSRRRKIRPRRGPPPAIDWQAAGVRRWPASRGAPGGSALARRARPGYPFAHERQGHDAGPRREDLVGRAAGPVGRRHRARPHPHAALRAGRLRGHPLLP